MVKVQLHWCDYYQGKWSNRISSDINKYGAIAVANGFDASQVRIRITKEGDQSVGEGAVKVHLDFPTAAIEDPAYKWALRLHEVEAGGLALRGYSFSGPAPLPNYSFRVTSKNCDLVLNTDFYNFAPMIPYITTGVDATLFTGSGSLSAKFQNTFSSTGTGTTTTEPILQSVHSFAVLPPSNPVVPAPFLNPTEPDYVEAGSLVSPFFYKDTSDPNTTDELTFYVQPQLTETTINEWTWWAVSYPAVSAPLINGSLLSNLAISPQTPTSGPAARIPIDEESSIYSIKNAPDWLTSPATTVLYNGTLVGQTGGIDVKLQPATVAGKTSASSPPQPATSQPGKVVLSPDGLTSSQIHILTKVLPAGTGKSTKQ